MSAPEPTATATTPAAVEETKPAETTPAPAAEVPKDDEPAPVSYFRAIVPFCDTDAS